MARLFRQNRLDQQLELFSFKRDRSLLVFGVLCIIVGALMGCAVVARDTQTGTEYGLDLFRKEKAVTVPPPMEPVDPPKEDISVSW